MTTLARRPIPNRRARFACKRIRMKKRSVIQENQNTQNPSAMSTLITFLFLITVFIVLAYSRVHQLEMASLSTLT